LRYTQDQHAISTSVAVCWWFITHFIAMSTLLYSEVSEVEVRSHKDHGRWKERAGGTINRLALLYFVHKVYHKHELTLFGPTTTYQDLDQGA